MTWVHLPYIRHKGEHNINFTYEYFFLIMLLNKSFFLSETENANFQHTFSYKKCLGKNQNRFSLNQQEETTQFAFRNVFRKNERPCVYGMGVQTRFGQEKICNQCFFGISYSLINCDVFTWQKSK